MSETLPAQSQAHLPSPDQDMDPRPAATMAHYRAAGKLAGKTAIISGGESGIGRAVAVGFAKEGADVAISWLNEREDAAETVRLIEAEGRLALSIPGDIGNPDFARELVRQVVAGWEHIDILVNNAAEQHVCEDFSTIADEQVERIFRTNILGQFWLTRSALPHIPDGGAIINTASVTAFTGSAAQIDFAATEGAVVAFTRSLAMHLMKRNIRVNAVAPGPIGTPSLPANYHADTAALHGSAAPMARPGQPDAVAPSYIFLASSDASTMTGQVLHPNGGMVVNG
jgi:NAD(P)-dependent dehydrogenase (short-subunit alcohol dehydrogenase family)